MYGEFHYKRASYRRVRINTIAASRLGVIRAKMEASTHNPILYDSELIHTLVVDKETYSAEREISRVRNRFDIAQHYWERGRFLSTQNSSPASLTMTRNERPVDTRCGFRHPALVEHEPPLMPQYRRANYSSLQRLNLTPATPNDQENE